MLVTISGVDGCGKTTQAQALQSAFNICHLKSDYVWYRGGSASWLAFLLHRLRPRHKTLGVASPEDRIADRQKRLRTPWRRAAWSWLTTFELLLRYTWSVSLPLGTGKVVISDRYVDDTLADWSAYFGDESVEQSIPARLLRWLTPRPNLAYWLDVPASVAQQRSSDDLPTHFLEALSATYRRQSQSSPTGRNGLQRVDGTAAWEEISQRIAREVLGAYFANYHTVLNSLFRKNPGQWR
jgi:thymidylate kinase